MTRRELPGPKAKEWLDLSSRYEPSCTSRQAPVVWDTAQGVRVRDVDGNDYIDLTSGVLVTNVGHCHPKHVAAIREAAGRLLNCYDFPTPARVEFAGRLVDLMPENLDRAFLLTTGSEATESAMRVSKRLTGRHEIVSFHGAFHGRTYGAMSVGGRVNYKKNFGPMMPGCIHVPYPYCYRCPFEKEFPDCDYFCVEFMDTVIAAESTGDIAALIVEPYQGTAGFVFPPEGYLPRLQRWAEENDAVFILDEVQSSFGRTGKMFAMEWENLRPNLLCLGKGIGSGVPTAALMGESRVFDCLSPGEMSSTTGGNPFSCAAGLAVLDIMRDEDLPGNALRMGEYMMPRLKEIQGKCPYLGDVRGRGLVTGLEFVADKKTKEPAGDICRAVVQACCENGLLVGKVGAYGHVIRIAPPLVINKKEADEALDILEAVLTRELIR